MYTTIKAYCVDQALQVASIPKLASGGENCTRIEVTFDDKWTGYGKVAVLYRNESQVYHVVMVDDACTIPRVLMAEPGVLYFGILGTSGSITRPTEVVALTVERGVITGLAPFEPLPDVYKQVLSAYGEVERRLAEETAARKSEVAVERARLDNLVANGGASNDAELVDVRVDAFGNIFDSAGAAIRGTVLAQQNAIEAGMTVAYLAVDHEKIENMGLALNSSGQAILVASTGVNLYAGVIEKTGYYNLPVKTLVTLNELNESTYTNYISYDTAERADVFLAAGTHYYVLGVAAVPCLRVVYSPEHILVTQSPEANNYNLTEGGTVAATEMEGLLTDTNLQLNSGRYTLFGFPVACGRMYRLQSDSFVYPSDVYQLFGFVKTMNLLGHLPYIKGGVCATTGAVDILLKSPIDGYLMVSNDSDTPTTFALTEVTGVSRNSIVYQKAQPYNKLLTIGDSLSGNSGLWQPTAIEGLNIQGYTTLGGAGLTVADQGADVNTIYNRVMTMEAEAAVDLITFWGGFNDFNSDIVLSSLSEQLASDTRDATTFYGGVLDCVEKIMSTYPLAQVVMVGTTPFSLTNSWQDATNDMGLKIEDYVNAFREVAEYYSIPFLDLLHTSGFNTYNYSTYYLDQGYWLHPNSTGNALLGRKIAGFIKGLDGLY